MAAFAAYNCNAQYMLSASSMGNSPSSGTKTALTGPRSSMYANRGVTLRPGLRHLLNPITRRSLQRNINSLWHRNLNQKSPMDRATVKKPLYGYRVPVCFMEQLPAVHMVQDYLQHLNTDMLLAVINPVIDNIKDSSEAQNALQSIHSASDYSTVIHLRESLITAFHHVEQLVSHVVPRLDHVDVSTSTAQQFIDQIGVLTTSDYGNLNMEAMPGGMPAFLATVATSTVVVSSIHESRQGFSEGRDLPLRYDADLIAAYFKKRPMDIMQRSGKIMFECSSLTFNILWDTYVGREREMEKLRARQLVELITRLGPTAVKIGQALSIRPDILPQVYLEELQKLQDRVPPFSNEEAKQIILESLGKPAEEIFAEMSEHPIAAASLGQVYKAKLRENGVPVAVKVQRPGVLEGISRDLFLLRIGAWLFQQVPMVQSDMVGLLDTWAFRFFDELDYVQEAHNGIQFLDNMKSLPNVTVPEMFLSYTSRKVLTSAWVVGEKLSESDPGDLLPMITTAMNCYLVQLLESGFLHADPHPGNLLKTPDGRLCVLDFGLMTQVTEDQRYTLIEYISHLMNSDYPRVADDLVRLGFVPEDRADPEKTAAAVPQLTRVMSQLIQGGGVRNINVQQMTDDIAKISKDYIFVIPPYFALILRAFSVLEGIGLDVDPDYSIVNACYPYLSKRLLTDDSPRTRAALKYFLYGDNTQLDIQRVEALASGFQSFRDIMAASHGGPAVPPSKVNYLDPTTKEALKLLFAPEGSYIQELILTEVVRAVDALSREALAELWHFFSQRVSLPSTIAIPGSWPLPSFVLGGVLGGRQMARLSPEDYKSLDLVRRLWMLVEPHLQRPSSATEFAEIAQDMAPVMKDLLPGVRTVAQRFAIMLFQRQTLRFADDLDGHHSVRYWDEDPAAFARRIQPPKRLPPPKQPERKLQQLSG
ncbi:hypothetical protein KC19_1G196600 [Ceratodon purpureus]|uniref:Protein kinase domain-containing protein n=1 Tax=Ceratodon purpureus TaxID=3225 RepID=A0A8T0J882_CERPU|nr:hypothetical protein KC19_1G196600 [Ceratodon purpureus]